MRVRWSRPITSGATAAQNSATTSLMKAEVVPGLTESMPLVEIAAMPELDGRGDGSAIDEQRSGMILLEVRRPMPKAARTLYK